MALHRCHHQPTVSTPINVDQLALELLNHPNHDFVTTLVDALRYGTRIGYTGPQKARVSRNLISASQHPGVVSANLCKEIQLGRVAGPFPFVPLSNFDDDAISIIQQLGPGSFMAKTESFGHLLAIPILC